MSVSQCFVRVPRVAVQGNKKVEVSPSLRLSSTLGMGFIVFTVSTLSLVCEPDVLGSRIGGVRDCNKSSQVVEILLWKFYKRDHSHRIVNRDDAETKHNNRRW